MKKRDWFFYSTAAILVLTALAKVYSTLGSVRALSTYDELLHIRYRPLMVLAALLELGVALYLVRSRSDLKRASVVLWLSVNFMLYHFGNYLLGITICPCLGTLTARLPLPPGYAEHLLLAFITYWFLGSFYIVWRDWIDAQEASLAAEGSKLSVSASD